MQRTSIFSEPLRALQALFPIENPRWSSSRSVAFTAFFSGPLHLRNSKGIISSARILGCAIRAPTTIFSPAFRNLVYEGYSGRQKMNGLSLAFRLDCSFNAVDTRYTFEPAAEPFGGASLKEFQTRCCSKAGPSFSIKGAQLPFFRTLSVGVAGKNRRQKDGDNRVAKALKKMRSETGPRHGDTETDPLSETLDTSAKHIRNDNGESVSLYEEEDSLSDTEDDDTEFTIIEDRLSTREMEDELAGELEDDFEDLGDDDEIWDDDEEDANDVAIGDGGYGGGVVFGDVEWGERSLELAQQIVAESGNDLSIFAFKASRDGRISVRLDKLSDLYGSPTMKDIEKFSKRFRGAMEDPSAAPAFPDNIDLEVNKGLRLNDEKLTDMHLSATYMCPDCHSGSVGFIGAPTKPCGGDIYMFRPVSIFRQFHLSSKETSKKSRHGRSEPVEEASVPSSKSFEPSNSRAQCLSSQVSSPGAERVIRVPEDLERFKELPMYVQYSERKTDAGDAKDAMEKDGVLQLDSVDISGGTSVWKVADVKINRQAKGKGRPLNSQQRKWRATLPFASLKQVRLYLDV